MNEQEKLTLNDLPEAPLVEEQSIPSSVTEAAPAQEKAAEMNFRLLREERERVMRERDELARKLQEIQQRSQPVQAEEDEDLHIGPDDIAEGKHLSKVQQKIRRLENQLKSYQQQNAETLIETKLRNTYPDFDKIVSAENIELLRQQHPEIVNSLQSIPDLYGKGASAYTMIKKLVVNEGGFTPERQRTMQNLQKPRSSATLSPQQGDTPLSRANAFEGGLTDDLKKQLYKEILESRKSY